jgi:hypothetical protein
VYLVLAPTCWVSSYFVWQWFGGGVGALFGAMLVCSFAFGMLLLALCEAERKMHWSPRAHFAKWQLGEMVLRDICLEPIEDDGPAGCTISPGRVYKNIECHYGKCEVCGKKELLIPDTLAQCGGKVIEGDYFVKRSYSRLGTGNYSDEVVRRDAET